MDLKGNFGLDFCFRGRYNWGILGPVAQLGAHYIRIVGVGSSNLLGSTKGSSALSYGAVPMLENLHGGICVPDYKAMYYHLAGRMATAIDALEATTNALVDITEKLKLAQQTTEEIFLSTPDDDVVPPADKPVSK